MPRELIGKKNNMKKRIVHTLILCQTKFNLIFFRYMDFFPKRTPSHGSNKTFLFEKSATYFDKDVVPQRAFSLLNSSKLIVILISPAKRAYSWYHHMRAHEDETAMSYTFHEVVTANPNHSSKALKALQSRLILVTYLFSTLSMFYIEEKNVSILCNIFLFLFKDVWNLENMLLIWKDG